MSSDAPAVTAMITVYNGEQWIRNAIDSLLGQSYADLEVLVVNDGSSDSTGSILDGYADRRIRVMHEQRMGRAAALEKAVREAKGEFIANLDADDECYLSRIENQVRFLREHPDHGWVGGGEDREDTQRNEHYVRYYPESDAAIRRMAVKCIPYCHSAVMFRRSVLEKGLNYLPTQPYLIDFEFFIRVARHFRVANLQIPVVKRRARQKSFFQSRFTTREQNRELSRLCSKARQAFGLPLWMEAYPIARSVYPVLPDCVKQTARRALGLQEMGSATQSISQ